MTTFIISYKTKDGILVLNYVVDAASYKEAIDIIKDDVLIILSCVSYKK
jgi:hypothetical protein